MKSITIQGSEKAWSKVATKKPTYAGEVPCVLWRRSTSTFSAQEKSIQNLVYTLKRSQGLILVTENHLTAILQDIQVHL
jgi:hypothetical protein